MSENNKGNSNNGNNGSIRPKGLLANHRRKPNDAGHSPRQGGRQKRERADRYVPRATHPQKAKRQGHRTKPGATKHEKKVAFVLGVAIGTVCCAVVSLGVMGKLPSASAPPAAAPLIVSSEASEHTPAPTASKRAPSPAQTPSSTPAPSLAHTTSPAHTPSSDTAPAPSASGKRLLAMVFDDAGGDLTSLEHCLSLPFPITVAVLPGLKHSRECADAAKEAGAQVLLHQPMQAQNLAINPGCLAITPSMTADEAAELVASNMASLGGVAGVNNHEGSLITEDASVMEAILRCASGAGAYFLDSRTTSGTQVGQASSITGIPYYERDVFLDNSHDKEAILSELHRACTIADRDGAAIMIGHVRADDALVAALKEAASSLEKEGYTFCTVSCTNALQGT